MAHAVVEERPLHMGLPVSHGKLAMWLFLVTEIMFFTGLIGTYIVLRNGSKYWATPEQVHLIEWIGALNQFLERHTDAQMLRTENRPLPAGRLLPLEVLTFGVTAGAVGLAYLAIALRQPTAALVAAVTFATYVFL